MAPQQLIIVTVFDKDDAGTLYPAGEPRRFDTEAGAVQAAKNWPHAMMASLPGCEAPYPEPRSMARPRCSTALVKP